VVRAVHHNIILLHEDTVSGVDDQRDGSGQPVWPRGGETKDGDTTRVRGGRRHNALVRVVDTVRRDGLAGRFRPEGVHHATWLDGASALLQGGQLHGPVDLCHYAPTVQDRTDQIAVDKKVQEATAGLQREKGMGPSIAIYL